MIPHRIISLLANRLAKEGGRRLREEVLERDYCLAWLLAGVAESEIKAVLGFKGGTGLDHGVLDTGVLRPRGLRPSRSRAAPPKSQAARNRSVKSRSLAAACSFSICPRACRSISNSIDSSGACSTTV